MTPLAPGKPGPLSNVVPIVMVEQLNPPRGYQIDVRPLLAVHKCIGIQKDGRIVPLPVGHG